MATLLIETKEVKALDVNLTDVSALIDAVYKKPVEIGPFFGSVMVDIGTFTRAPMERVRQDTFNRRVRVGRLYSMDMADLFQDLVNRDELPEGRYLLNTSPKVDEFAQFAGWDKVTA